MARPTSFDRRQTMLRPDYEIQHKLDTALEEKFLAELERLKLREFPQESLFHRQERELTPQR